MQFFLVVNFLPFLSHLIFFFFLLKVLETDSGYNPKIKDTLSNRDIEDLTLHNNYKRSKSNTEPSFNSLLYKNDDIDEKHNHFYYQKRNIHHKR